ncbi:base plate lysozyme [Synechococcus phage S-PM2]|uniref:Base plate lysozyme n=1 Tax=Synechococcus phage S-PM2 TaxID=238854 RepID=Q5GQC6_BPSYP|nr:baseplate hub and tail lysozyme [Synechococcus phage S-PM2]CAF34276.2 base plate lysozyme [Synechococcus phage S-PM2]CFW42440.1 base plate lysozyme [Synechococcus phage S-PM2]
MSIENATTHQPSANQKKFQSKGAARPEGSSELEEGQFCNSDFHVIATKHGWTMGSYTNSDGTNGFILSNGQSMFHFDVNGNIILATGQPGQSGCGGKVVIHAKNQHQVSDSINIHVRGNDDEAEKETGSSSGGDVKKTPAYSIYVEGDVAIESQGGDIGVKGDNITLNAINNLTLRAGESINIEAGEGQGKINMVGTDVNTDSSFVRFTTSGGFYVDGSGEFSVNQKDKPGASASINTIGDINHVVTGNYYMRARGNYQVDSDTGHILFKSLRGGTAFVVNGDSSETIRGNKRTKILGKSSGGKSQKDATYSLELGPGTNGSLGIKASSYLDIKAVGTSVIDSTLIDLKAKGAIKMNGKSIFLN